MIWHVVSQPTSWARQVQDILISSDAGANRQELRSGEWMNFPWLMWLVLAFPLFSFFLEFIYPKSLNPWVYVVGRFRLLYHGLAWVLSNPCILPETRVQLGIEPGVTSSSTMGGVMLLGMVIPCSILSLIITRAHFDYEKQREGSRLKATIRDLQPSHSHFQLIQLQLLLVICLVSIQPWVVHLFPGHLFPFRDIMERMEHLLHSMLSG